MEQEFGFDDDALGEMEEGPSIRFEVRDHHHHNEAAVFARTLMRLALGPQVSGSAAKTSAGRYDLSLLVPEQTRHRGRASGPGTSLHSSINQQDEDVSATRCAVHSLSALSRVT